jgi:hypothetical protein
MTGPDFAALEFCSTALSLRLIGGGNFPAHRWRVNSNWPLAVLELRGDVLSLRMRMSLLGSARIDVRPDDVVTVFPVRGPFGSAGVGLRPFDGRDWYFWTRSASPVLDELARQGFSVSGEVQRANWFRS